MVPQSGAVNGFASEKETTLKEVGYGMRTEKERAKAGMATDYVPSKNAAVHDELWCCMVRRSYGFATLGSDLMQLYTPSNGA
jgi:hypothetical protein